ncbi:ubiquitin-like 1-activating enzyme E1 B [Cryptococcus deuterogattii 99/473]|uniref:Ubiquitin-activating enzyme E1-like n=2 Tax=Cryptococcus deuterogattii TaxID=1859096 RepID=A0A0D0T3F7_9TREE|nr:ubiquitin-like 1-activating enzyme E1 B [Cryptococcus deuterogattii R265]KIR40292.1 ubiquitin-like 1-activating enzyme E1 B [Cryptococcus deuterogattii Ram5]KIR72003.1 ubiquitin-like 1-activating enzyme E1 B [Cryptococcus deuterogattii CA1014]KIY58533.1 ubiquitin-like 1-activating enzyme E1 B [Cryptococcus deuterogattii 99/473]
MPRSTYTEALLGPEVYRKVRETNILVVGAGGIGCELLKNLVLVGFANIEIIDLDTIDLSNLNRQFLFRKPDISKSKALVAAATARHFNPNSGININARHGNVKDSVNDLEWIKGFGLVMNALDNMDARRHVNRLCQAAGVPLIESGTAGYLGQVTPMIKDVTECFDCVPKPTPKAFPICTIRSTPSEPIHCIVWGKTYLFGKLFGEDDEDMDTEELDKAKASGENAEEIENLKMEAAAFRQVRKSLGEEDGPRRVFHKIFNEDICRLLAMEDMWKKEGRVKPVPLDCDAILNGTSVTPPLRTAPTANQQANSDKGAESAKIKPAALLKDQKELSLKENLELFLDSCKRLSARALAFPDTSLSFDKDDDDTLDFVLATANLRATAYGIPNKTRFQVKEMAGNIIPAIATTNAIIAGLIVMQSLNILSRIHSASNGDSSSDSSDVPVRNVFLRTDPTKPLGSFVPQHPDPTCSVCRDVYIPFKADVGKCTLGQFVEDVVKGWLGSAEFEGEGEGEDVEWTVFEGGRLLADPDFEDNFERTLEDLGVGRGKIMTVRDEDTKYRPVHFCVCQPEPEASTAYTLPDEKPTIPFAPAKPEAAARESSEEPAIVEHVSAKTAPNDMPSATAGVKRPAPEDDEQAAAGGDDAKKRRVTTVVDDDNDFEIL